MIDIHSHVLPGLDDGAPDLEEAIRMAEATVAEGVHTVVATPHAFCAAMDVAPDARDQALEIFLGEVRTRNIPLRVLPGFECRINERLVDQLEQEPRYLLPPHVTNSHHPHVLLELGNDMPFVCIETILFRCQIKGTVPVLAHPERHPHIHLHTVESFVRKGGKLQITAAALIGKEGGLRQKISETFLRQGLVAFIASDAHRFENVLGLRKAYNRAQAIIGPVAAHLFSA